MIIIGLTGSIGSGKTTVTRQFAECGAATLDSDAVVHALLAEGGAAVEEVGKRFPLALDNNRIDRQKLGKQVFGDKNKLRDLEGILHPLVRQAQDDFILEEKKKGTKFVVLDIPLLFETGGEKRCHATVVTSASYDVQRERVLARQNMTEEKFASILAAQMPDAEKRQRADFLVSTDGSREQSLEEVKKIIASLKLDKRFHDISNRGSIER